MLRNGGFRSDAIRFGSVAASQLLADPRGVLANSSAMQHAPDVPDKPSTDLDRARVAAADADQSDEAADRRARFEESLSAEDRALLLELERRRLAYVEAGEAVDVVNAPAIGASANAIEEATFESGRTAAAEVTDDDQSGAPRRRRKKELVA